MINGIVNGQEIMRALLCDVDLHVIGKRVSNPFTTQMHENHNERYCHWSGIHSWRIVFVLIAQKLIGLPLMPPVMCLIADTLIFKTDYTNNYRWFGATWSSFRHIDLQRAGLVQSMWRKDILLEEQKKRKENNLRERKRPIFFRAKQSLQQRHFIIWSAYI